MNSAQKLVEKYPDKYRLTMKVVGRRWYYGFEKKSDLDTKLEEFVHGVAEYKKEIQELKKLVYNR